MLKKRRALRICPLAFPASAADSDTYFMMPAGNKQNLGIRHLRYSPSALDSSGGNTLNDVLLHYQIQDQDRQHRQDQRCKDAAHI